MADFVESLIKKDPDAVIIDISKDGTEFIIQSDLVDMPMDFEEIVETPELIDPYTKTNVKVVRVIFTGNAIIAYMSIIFGIIPYMGLELISVPTRDYILWSLVAVTGVVYVLMAVFKNMSSIICFAFFLSFTLGAACAHLNNMALLQAGLIVFAQSMTVAIITTKFTRELKIWQTVISMLVVGLVVWLVGIYAFVEQHDWVSAGILAAFNVVFTIYSFIQIKYIDRYSLSKDNLTIAMANFYTDPICIFT